VENKTATNFINWEANMNLKLISTRNVVMALALLMLSAVSAFAASITLNGATGNSCIYSAFNADSGGNLTVVCNSAPSLASTSTPTVVTITAPVVPSTGGGPAPTLNSPVSEVKRWIYAFESLNFIPHDRRSEPFGTMNYWKLIQANKPTQYKLPTDW